MYYRGSHTHSYKHHNPDGGTFISVEHHHKYEHKVLTPLGWLTEHWNKHKSCPKH